ncbi:PWWP domain-containing DNA repair factor 3B [Labeo rohita]|uniref:PWWP domain-containing DNA repair factor 3B n=2 Tax=Labeo rohita TaxID=84645 RepID=A0ABQ8MY13_LABRO|nr:PWWP domain-containing DNA repair factor 3B [Labeo rohita]
MSSSDNSSHRRRNPPRNCRILEDLAEPNKPVSGEKASILYSKGTTVSQLLNPAESCGQGKANQNAPPGLSACLQKSTPQPMGKNEVEPMVPQKITTTKCPLETSTRSKRGRKKKLTQPSEIAASKACSDGLDNSEHNPCPEQHLSSQKTKGTRYWHSKKTQNSQTPSDVLHTCTTVSPPHHKEISSCHTNGDCTSMPHTPKRGRTRKRPLLSSTPTSNPQPLSPERAQNSCQSNSDCTSITHTPKRGRPRTRPHGSSTPISDLQPLSPKTDSCKTNGDCSSVPHTPKRGRPRTRPHVSSTPISDLQPLSPKTDSCKTNGDCSSVPLTPKRGRPRTRPHISSTPISDLQPLSPKTDNCRTNGDCSSVPLTPKRGRPRTRPHVSSTPISDLQPLSPTTASCKTNGDCTSVPLTPKRGRPRTRPHVSSTPISDLQPLSPKTDSSKTNSDCTSVPLTPKRGRPRTRPLISSPLTLGLQPLSPKTDSSKTNGDCTSVPLTPKRGRPRTRPLISSPLTLGLQPLSPKRAKNSCIPHAQQNVKESSLVKTPPINGTPSRRVKPQRFAAAGRPRGRKKKNMVEQSIAPPPVKRCRKSATSPLKSTQEEPSVETLPINKACFETQLPEPQESDQNVSSDLSIELSLQEEPHPLNNSLFMEEEEDLDDDDEELPSFLQQDSKKPLSISEGLCVWCKLRKYPYWPAVVKSVNHKNKKASIVFIDCYVNDQKRIRKGFSVSLRTLKPFDCEEYEKLVDIAKETYGNAITWALELISDYRIRIGCGSFSGSFIEYCAADISFPVRRKYSEGTSVMTFPIQEILSEQCDNPDSNIEDIVVEEQDELLSKKVLPDRSKAARNRANKQLVDFIIRRKVENRLLAVISGRESSKWMQALQRPSRPVVDIYLEDEEQVDKVYRYLDKVCDGAPQINTCLENIQADRIRLILDVLLPEAIIYAIAGVYKLSLEKAEEKYRRGPCFSNRERQEFDMMIEQQMKLKEITQRHRQ